MDYGIETYSYLRYILFILKEVEHSDDYIIADYAMKIKDDLERKLKRIEEGMGVDCTFKEACKQFLDSKSVTYLAENFGKWGDRYGYRSYNGRRKDNRNTYSVAGKCYEWHKVECELYGEDQNHPKLMIIMRKEAGLYLIITYEDRHIIEMDYNGKDGEFRVLRDDEDAMWQAYAEYRTLFDMLGISPMPTETRRWYI